MNSQVVNWHSPPFSSSLLNAGGTSNPGSTHTSCSSDVSLQSTLPASYRKDKYDVGSPTRDTRACIKRELDLQRLDEVFEWLWVAGRPVPPRALHYQVLARREIIISEEMDMHLVWTGGRIFLKPLPRFLLEKQLWTEYLCCKESGECALGEHTGSDATAKGCRRRNMYKVAFGFLFSYAALIANESDFYIAKDKHLLPQDEALTWQWWRNFVAELITEQTYNKIDRRFIYGELRLSRLNKIYKIRNYSPLRGYMSRWDQYGTFFRDNFTWLASFTVYIAIVLTAMQVGLATKSLTDNNAFQAASYGFTVFSIIGPLIGTGIIVLTFLYIFVSNLLGTLAFKKKRFQKVKNMREGVSTV